MKKIGLFISILLSTFLSYAQTGTGDDFEAATLNTAAWTTTNAPLYGLFLNKTSNPTASQLLVDAKSGASANYQGFNYNFSALNLTDYPYVSVKVKTSTAFVLRIDLVDNAGNTTNKVDTKFTTTANSIYTTYIFDFTNKFNTQSGGIVNSTQITKLSIMVNPGKSIDGVQFNMDSVMVGSRAKIPYTANLKGIKLNQLGFFTNGSKTAVVNGAKGSSFYVVNEANNVVYTGTLAAAKNYPYSLETVQLADFSNFKTPGRYKLTADGLTASSYSFVISATPLNEISKGSIKGFYYQRASTPLLSANAGKWARNAGHPDNAVIVHNSAGADVVKAGDIISSPQGWYDAGDYNKYVVNAGISTYTLLACYEHFPSYYDTLNLNIPESNNTLPDILDEALWEIRWLLTMQDPYDGGVYHKLTTPDFDGDEMPEANTAPRYVVQKSTAATLDFAAIMAQAARVFANYPNELPGFSDQCIKAAKQAYNWAGTTPNLAYVQSKLHDPPIKTGEYGDSYFGDELKWAMNELFTTTLKPEFYSSANISAAADMPGWPNVYTLGLISLGHNRKKIADSLSNPSDTTLIKNKIITLAKDYMTYATVPSSTSSAYAVAMGKNTYDFGWGSNSVAANQALILIQAFNYTKDSSYLKAALSNVDYLLGRNPLGYCYVTGYGSLYPNNPHHRISQSDNVAQAVPGLLVGGPNAKPDVTGETSCPTYPSTLPALSYMDNDCSYSTNEIAINWNAPLAYITGAVQSIYSGIEPTTKDYYVHLSTTNPVNKNIHFNVYPNPTTGNLYVEKPFSLTASPIILDLSGREYTISSDWTNDKIIVNTSDLKEGMYLIRLEGENGAAVQKFTVTK